MESDPLRAFYSQHLCVGGGGHEQKGRPHHSLPVRKSLVWKQKRGNSIQRQSIKWFGHFHCENSISSSSFEQNTPTDIRTQKSYCWCSLLLNGWI
ncbi:hypothetical protein CDAR_547771 [Caerostris darwini]|uniref:Uncharacterized protein n=1 Tax=Caerostris darwini TaxID=1538125 RepID=A0AAV4WFH9_9ARAC|nr:hypothetical protein CDAR_547771 [Caerostris darwini]